MNAAIFIATPCFGGLVTQSYMQSIIGCMMTAQDHGIDLTLSMVGNDALITRCRNTLLQQFLSQTDMTHILFIDSDIGFEPDAVIRIASHKKDVVAGLYPLKDRYWDDLTDSQIARGEPARTASLRYVGETEALHETPCQDSLQRVAYAGTGFLLISRAAVERMIHAYPETRYARIDATTDRDGGAATAHALFDCMIDPKTGTYLSEDFTFCHRWRAIGGEVWLGSSIILSHTGPSSFTGEPARRIGILAPSRA